MSTLERRETRGILPDLFDWFDAPFTAPFTSPFSLLRNGEEHAMRVEDYVENGDHVIRAELPGIDPDKDVDGLNPVNSGRLVAGLHGFLPCTPLGCLMLLKDQRSDLSGLDAMVIGRSNLVGKPMALLLLGESCTVTVAHSRTRGLADLVRRADIVVAAVGRPEMVRGDWIKPGATVIDVGMNRLAGEDGKARLLGDVDFAGASEVAGAITPVPGGVGPMTIAVLLRNTLAAAHARAGLPPPEGL